MSGPAIDPRFHVPPRRVIALGLFLAAVFWFARPVMLPFIVGAIIAYAFSPFIDALQARTGRSSGSSRSRPAGRPLPSPPSSSCSSSARSRTS